MLVRSSVLLLAFVLLAACSATAEPSAVEAEDSTPARAEERTESQPSAQPTTIPRPTTLQPAATPAPALARPATGEPAADRIVVATESGDVYLVDPDGGQRLDLTTTGAGGQPVWSPDGRRIAWSQRDPSGFSITSTNADGTERRRSETLFSGYFGYWSPTSAHLGFLGTAPPGTGLVVDTGLGADLDTTIDSDTFYYFSWSPDGTRWVVHSGSGFSIVSLDGTRVALDLDDARFRAPVWAPDGSILLAVRGVGRNIIVQLDPDTGEYAELLEVGDVSNFVLDPTGRFLAVELLFLGADESEPGDGITVSVARRQPGPRAEVVVYDLETGETRQILSERSGGFWWSPDGTTLALLVAEQAEAPAFAQWMVWRPDSSFRTERFTISATFGAAYVPFFDQYAQSVTPWSPDSTRFVYSGADEFGSPGVFVQPAQLNVSPTRIADDRGVAFWSPT